MNFNTAKLIRGSLSSMLRRAISLQLLSVFTSMFPVVVTIGFRVPKKSHKIPQNSLKTKPNTIPAISSSSDIISSSNRGGNLLETKSFKAVATAFTGMSSSWIWIFASKIYKNIIILVRKTANS